MTDERAASGARHIDVSRLPEDVVALIDALVPGESLVVTRNGAPIAAISGTGGGSRAPHVDAGQAVHDVTVVATAMKLSRSARASLSAALGGDYIVLDLHAAPTTADVLLVPSSSPQLIGILRSMFPKARVIVTEVEDNGLGVSYRGPVRRMLDAGADSYLTSTTIPRLAEQLDHNVTRHRELAAGTATRIEIESSTSTPDPPTPA
jgi:antitoxin (DNA-binding transcriptional repressor) of toxin-antitoxin stability system